MTLNERNILKIINHVIYKYNLHELINIEDKKIEVSNSGIKISDKRISHGLTKDGINIRKTIRDTTFHDFFQNYSKDRQNDKGVFYSFKEPRYALEILEEEKLYLPYLSKHLENDPLEYYELLSITSPHKSVFDRQNIKDNIFIHCFTKDFRNNKFWSTYGTNKETNKKENVAIGFKFTKYIEFEKLINIIEFRDVIYNDKNRFDFIKEIQFRLYSDFGRILKIDSEFDLARFFKREKYRWEDEVRLCIDLYKLDFIKEKYKQIFPEFFNYNVESIYTKKNNALFVQMSNEFFKFEVCELICGIDISQPDFTKLQRIANIRNIPIWKYS